tara:strand:- start:2557 stop:2820 length:264 start_codon:yes stop_codon:yes gene_type:complete
MAISKAGVMPNGMGLNKQEAILLEIAIGDASDRCAHCDVQIATLNETPHPEHCLMERARKSLGDKWVLIKAQRDALAKTQRNTLKEN